MKKQAFTIMELLIVLAIITLLIAISIPCLQKTRHLVRQLTCTNNLRQIGVALDLYQNDNDGYGPFLGIDPSAYPIEEYKTPEQMLSSYLGHEWSVWNCPEDLQRKREIWYPITEPNVPEEILEISYVWSEPLLQGFYPGHHPENINGTKWRQVKYDYLKGAVLADGKRMLNVWDWKQALDKDYIYHSLDQSHGTGRYHKINLLYSDIRVETIMCNDKNLENLLPF